MRMKLSKSSQLVLVTAASLAVAALITACQQFTQTLTVDFVYVSSALAAGANQYGEIDVFEINSESGRMRQIPTSPFPSEGRNPVAEAVSADYQNLFVVNQDDNSIVQFVIGIDGKIYPFNTVNTPGIYPLGIAVSKSAVFVLDTYQPLPLCSPADPCSGSIAVYPLSAATQNAPVGLQNPAMNPAVNGQYWPLTVPGAPNDVIVPTGVNVLASGAYVYVTAYDSTTSSPVGYVFAFSVASNGVLTAVPGSPFKFGAQPSAVSSDSKSAYVYVADSKNGDVWGFAVGSNGALTALSGSPYPAGNGPSAIVVNPTYPYVYVTNALDATVTAYSIGNSGVLTQIGDYATGLQPVAIGIDPSTNRYLYTANFLGNTVSNFQLSPTAGTLLNAQASPYASNTNPTAIVAIPHNGSGGGIQP
jgi:6-phosphogluconolactonase